MKRLIPLIQGIASTIVIVVIVGGLPLALAAMFGEPVTPVIDTYRDPLASDSTRTQTLLTSTLVTVIWAMWALFTAAIATEIVASIKGRELRLQIPGVHNAARQLVASATLTFSIFTTAIPSGAAIIQLPDPATTIEAVDHSTLDATSTHTNNTTATTTYTVESRDTFWSIAETRLGDGLRWREIRDLNIGSTMHDGTTLHSETETLTPGWELAIPTTQDAHLPQNSESINVEQGDHFWALATQALTEQWGRTPTATEITPYWQTMVTLNQNRLLPPGDPDMIYPGQQLIIPDTPTDPEAPTPTPDTGIDLEAPEVEPRVDLEALTPDTGIDLKAPEVEPRVDLEAAAPQLDGEPDNTDTEDSPAETQSDAGLPLALVAGGVAASALAVALRRLRRHSMAGRPKHTIPDVIDDDNIELEHTIAEAADQDSNWLPSALATLRPITSTPYQPTIGIYSSSQLEVAFNGAAQLAEPWRLDTSAENETIWQLERDQLPEPAESETNNVPAMISIGTGVGDEQYLLNLEVGALAITGQPDLVEGLIRAIAFELTSQTLDVDIRVMTEIAGLPRWPSDVEEVATEIDLWCSDLNETFTNKSIHTPFDWRATTTADWFAPMVVVVDGEAFSRHDQLATAANNPATPVAAVVVGDPPSFDPTWRIDITDTTTATLYPHRLRFRPNNLSTEAASQLNDLHDKLNTYVPYQTPILPPPEPNDTSAASDAPTTQPTENSDTADKEQPHHIDDYQQPTSPPLRLTLLGEVAMDGINGNPLAPQQLAIVTYLTLNGRPVARPTLIHYVWGGSRVSPKRVSNVIAGLRQAVGRERLPDIAESGRYELRNITSDLAEFEDHVRKAAGTDDPTEKIGHLTDAINLVTGTPLTTRSDKTWAWSANYAIQLEAMVADTAADLCDLLAETNQWNNVIDIATTMLNHCPLAEPLVLHQVAAYKHLNKINIATRIVDHYEEECSAMGLSDPSDRPRNLLAS